MAGGVLIIVQLKNPNTWHILSPMWNHILLKNFTVQETIHIDFYLK